MTPSSPPAADVAELARFLRGCARVAVITGAGCSTASGIGDYRDDRGGWKRRPPVLMQDFLGCGEARRRYWARSMLGWPMLAAAVPNAAHRALAALEARFGSMFLITQNVDGLHQRAGQRAVLELHGRLAAVVCLGCGARGTRAALQTRLERSNPQLVGVTVRSAPDGDADPLEALDLSAFEVPDCAGCGGLLKPDVVFYGDSVPRERVAEAYQQVEQADALLIVGSSLMVYSSWRFCRRAHERGIPMVAVNRGVTRADDWLSFKVAADCTRVLPALAAA